MLGKTPAIGFAAIALNPGYVRVWIGRGSALHSMGNHSEALGYINRSIDPEPSDAAVWIHKGDILKAMGKQAEADAAYNQSKQLPEQYLGGESV